MTLSRREMMLALGTVPASVSVGVARLTDNDRRIGPVALPDKSGFEFEGVYLNAAYTHPMGKRTYAAAEEFLQTRMRQPGKLGPQSNARDAAVALFARLINASPGDIAVVPSTMEGENLIAAALGLGADAGVVTDEFHYSLALYCELQRRGVPLAVAPPRDNRIELADLEALITTSTRLVAVSLVGSDTGFRHDLTALCEIAHRKGAFVYADIIQAAGALPVDVKATGVDFCCAGAYKWLMGDFGVAFLYVRPDRLQHLRRVQVGWRQVRKATRHLLPYDPPAPPAGEWELGTDTAGLFEVSTPDWAGLAALAGSLTYLHDVGVDAIVRHRRPLIERLQGELPRKGFVALTPGSSDGPIAAFSYEGARARFQSALQAAQVNVQLGRNSIRISPSVYNDMHDIETLLRVLMV